MFIMGLHIKPFQFEYIINILNNRMAFNPFNLFKGNPKVVELINNNQPIELLLAEDPFVSQFKKTQNAPLKNYMKYSRYQQLVTYITVLNQSDHTNTNRCYKFPFASAEILSINNEMTKRFLLQEVEFIQEQVQQEVQVEKQLDSEQSQRSYSSIKSNSSAISNKSGRDNKLFEEGDKENFVMRAEEDKTLGDYSFSEEKQICQDDFPDVKIRRTILVKQLQKKIIKRARQPLILKLLDYFEVNQVIHILDGYVCKVLDSILNNYFAQFLAIVRSYGRFDKFRTILTHIESYSVQQMLLNFVTKLMQQGESERFLLSEEVTFLEYIQTICHQNVPRQQSDIHSLQNTVYVLNLYALIIEKNISKIDSKLKQCQKSSEERKSINLNLQLSLIKKILLKQSVQALINNLQQLIEDQQQLKYQRIAYQKLRVIKWIISAFCIIKKIQTNQIISKDQIKISKDVCQGCEDCFDKLNNLGVSYLLDQIMSTQIEQGYVYKSKRALSSQIQFMQILGLLIGQNVYFSRKSLIDSPSYQYLLMLLDRYPNSSILHNCLTKLVLPFLNSDNQLAIIDKFFQKAILLKFIYTAVKLDLEIRFQKKQKSRKCFISQIAAFCMAIDALDRPDSKYLCQYKKSKQWLYIKEYLVEDQKGLNKKVLGGHQKLLQKNPIILFSKEDSLNHFKIFLAGNKFNLFEDFQNFSPKNSDSSEEREDNDRIFNFPMQQDLQASLALAQASSSDSKYFSEDVVL